jgi:hypothetical protein
LGGRTLRSARRSVDRNLERASRSRRAGSLRAQPVTRGAASRDGGAICRDPVVETPYAAAARVWHGRCVTAAMTFNIATPDAPSIAQRWYRDALGILPLELWLVALAGLVLFGVAVGFAVRQARRAALKRRFGDEYARAVEECGSEAAAVRELRAREARVARLSLHSLNDRQRDTVDAEWQKVRALFIENPLRAVRNANHLIKTLMRERGYRDAMFEQRLADLSVDHAPIVKAYRAARELTEQEPDPRLATENLRRAMVHYDTIIQELEAPTARAAAAWRENRAT